MIAASLPVARLRGLTPEAVRLIASSRSDETHRAYCRALERLELWLAGRVLDDRLLADYLGGLDDRGLAPASARLVVSAVRYWARFNDIPDPGASHTVRALQGFARRGRHRGRGQVAGLRWEDVDTLVAHLLGAPVRRIDRRDAALLCVMSDLLLRAGECSALRVADVEFAPAGDAVACIRASKTDPSGLGAVRYLGPPTVERLRAWLADARIDDGPVFRGVDRHGRLGAGALGPRSIRNVIARAARAAGIGGRISGHSPRVGAAQSLAASGATEVEMEYSGRWSSPAMPARYAAGEIARRSAVARLRYGLGDPQRR